MSISKHIAKSHTPLIIAELSANHNQSLEIAKDSIRAIAACGADGVKLQTYTPECLTLQSNEPHFCISGGTLWDKRNLYELYKEAQTPWEWHKELFSLAKKLGLLIFSSPFSPKGVAFLESLQCPIYKVASFEAMHYELIEAIAKTKKPIIISTGVATRKELKTALEICHKYGCKDITLLHCISEYPAPLESANLLAMPQLAKTYKKYNIKYGLSDHTLGALCPSIATSLGASMIEKHFILDSSLGGVDSAFSMNKDEFKTMVEQVRDTALALGCKKPKISADIRKKRRQFARSIWVSADIKKGEKFTHKNLSVVRPSGGEHPRYLHKILGKSAKVALKAAQPLRLSDVK